MNNDNRFEPVRRRVLQAVLLLGAASPLLVSRSAFAQKTSKQVAHYQDKPNGNLECSKCMFFMPPKNGAKFGSCQVVKGEISPHGWCQYYTPKA